MTDSHDVNLQGPCRLADGSTKFRVWAPRPARIALRLVDNRSEVLLRDVGDGYREALVRDVPHGALYYYRLGGVDRPDPASRFQLQGVHGPSQVTSRDFPWTDGAWRGRAWSELVIYEAHVGTFTSEGTFAAMIGSLAELVELGVTALQLMPVAQFPGGRNWGYDGVHPYAPQNTYGGPEGLKSLIDACHAHGLAVVLDVVYNHLGPEGNYLAEFGPYYTDRYRTPWGAAINYDGPESRAVRDFFIGNALYWLDEFHIDALRLDATHAIHDSSSKHFLRELAERVHWLADRKRRPMVLIAESNANDPRIVRSSDQGGYGLDAQLVDDFHRSLHTLLTPERHAWYGDFGSLGHFAKAYRDGYVLTGQYSRYRKRAWGNEPSDIPANRFVVFAQCHDTVGNRPKGDRLSQLVGFEELKLAAAATILSACTPMLFMGEEYAEPASFHYFTSHLDVALGRNVRAGRMREFASHNWSISPRNPQSEPSFARSRLTRALATGGRHATLRGFYRELLRLRREVIAPGQLARVAMRVVTHEGQNVVTVSFPTKHGAALVCFNFDAQPQDVDMQVLGAARWRIVLNSADLRWEGPSDELREEHCSTMRLRLSPKSCLLAVEALQR